MHESFLTEYQLNQCKRIDRAFAGLMMAQWVLAILIATTTPLHNNVWIAVLWGGLISSVPLYFAIFKPGKKVGRYAISICQMGFSALFIHILDGRIEAHFHIFGSLAFIAAYRDWHLLAVASIIIITNHLISGLYFPYSIYGLAVGGHWRWLEHAGWIIFEDIFLGYACIQGTKEMHMIANSNLELVKSQLEAENLNMKRTQFFSVISHEIRTPLNGIIGFSDFLKESPIPEEQKQYVNIIKQCSDTLLKLINDLLDFSKIDMGYLEIDPHPFNPHEIIDYLEKVFLLDCQKKKLNFSFEISEDVPSELYGDSHRIRQVLSNIVSNAIKFTESGGIHVQLNKVEKETNLYRWKVEDTGVGIKADYLSKIFSPYTQEFSSTARKYGGSGLGLSISKKLVELMGGQLSVESTLGKSTVFFFTIPLK